MCEAFLLCLFWKELRRFNVKESMLNKNLIKTVDKNETESKIENPAHTLKRNEPCFSSYKNRELKLILWWAWAGERKKSSFIVTFILSEEN